MSHRRHVVALENMITVQHKNSGLQEMKCPYLSSASKKKCIKMAAENMDEELSEFDMQHFCDGNPIYCYYFRTPSIQNKTCISKNKATIEILPEEIPLPTTILQNPIREENEFNLWKE